MKSIHMYSVGMLPVYVKLLLDDPGRVVPHPLLEQQVLDNTLRLSRRRDPTSGQGLNRFEACKHIHIERIARAKGLQAQVSFHRTNTHDTHR